MTTAQSLENVLYIQTQKLQNLETATDLIKSKSFIQEDLLNAYTEVCSISKGIQDIKEEIKLMENENERCKELSMVLKTLDNQIQRMEKNIPSKIHEYVNAEQPKNSKKSPKRKEFVNNNLNITSERNDNTINGNHIIPDMKSCKKVLFNEPDIPQVQPITFEEFIRIPKYIISRHSLETLNNLVSQINQIIKNKYLLLATGKSGRKKIEVDLYLQYKKDQNSLDTDEERTYFFTSADYERTIKAKLDKTKLNLLIALRHCRRLREIRTSKNVFYALIISDY